jgi:predicted O-linked N-acetylglucosamine transferase (SPINDLY family)
MEATHDTPAETLRAAYEFARQGELARAEQLCEQVLGLHGDLPDALLLRGAIEVQTGRTAQGAASVDRAIQGDPSRPAAHALLGDALRSLNRSREALDSYAAALRLAPQLASAQLGRGNALLDEGRPLDALASFDAVLDGLPNDAEALFGRGTALLRLQRCEEAVTSFDRAIAVRPRYAAAFSNRGGALVRLKRHAPALQSFDAAVAIDPTFAEAWYNRGCVLRELRQSEDALHALDRASQLRAEYVEAALGRGRVLLDLRRPREALAAFEQALQWRADSLEALRGRGDALLALGKPAEALAAHEQALQLDSRDAHSHNSRGNSLRVLKRYAEAIEAYDTALRVDANDASVHYNRGTAFALWGGHPDETMASYERALDLNPEFDYLTGALWFVRRNRADWSAESPAATAERIVGPVLDGRRVVAPFHGLSFTDSAAVQLRCAATYAADRCSARTPVRPFAPYRHQRIRVAYVSPDFREHAVSYLMAGVLERHDPERFEVIGISLRPAEPTAFGRRIERAFHRFIDASALSDDDVVELLRTLEVDIAVDLCGFTDGFRTQIFAQRAAPVQVNYLGFPGTLGAPFMDYLIADAFVIPREAQRHYAEHIVYLPHCFQANDDRRSTEDFDLTRRQAGLPQEAFVFCCFNNTCKINPRMFDIWMRLLDRTAGSVLWLLGPDESVRDHLRREAAARGIARQRLVFAERLPHAEHSSRLELADLFLDTLPFNAGATASDALWAGLPLLTCAGEAYAARMAGSLLQAIGLPELITRSLEDYEARALELAARPEELAALRRRLHHNRSREPLFDTDRFRRHLEAAYAEMWLRHERGDAPAGFTVAG